MPGKSPESGERVGTAPSDDTARPRIVMVQVSDLHVDTDHMPSELAINVMINSILVSKIVELFVKSSHIQRNGYPQDLPITITVDRMTGQNAQVVDGRARVMAVQRILSTYGMDPEMRELVDSLQFIPAVYINVD